MTESDTIVCKPTPWFLLRAVAMLQMFSVFAVMFYVDGSVGYRKKNEQFFLHQTFRIAQDDFSKMNGSGSLTPDAWKSYAAGQAVAFPKDPTILPKDLKQPMPWPEILQNYEKMKPLQWNLLWKEYTAQKGLNLDVPEEPYTAQKIREQWVVLWFCCALAAAAAYFLARTWRRSLRVDASGLTSQNGRKIPYSAMKRLDLRKWETKGLAFVEYEDAAGKGKVRIDGLTYGGFKKEQDEPAERLMRRIRASFSGEIIEYAATADASSDLPNSPSA